MSHDEPTHSWRDNKTALRLVRIGFLLQFYLPAVVCIVGFLGAYDYFLPMHHPDHQIAFSAQYASYVFHIVAPITLFVLIVQCAVFTLLLRTPAPRSAAGVLCLLIVMNILHSGLWMLADSPLTLIRLTPPTILYIIAIIVEWRTPRHASETNPS